MDENEGKTPELVEASDEEDEGEDNDFLNSNSSSAIKLHWHLDNAFNGIGYKHKLETTLRLAMQQKPDFVPTIVEKMYRHIYKEQHQENMKNEGKRLGVCRCPKVNIEDEDKKSPQANGCYCFDDMDTYVFGTLEHIYSDCLLVMYELMGREGNEIEEAKAILNRSIMRQPSLPENLFYLPEKRSSGNEVEESQVEKGENINKRENQVKQQHDHQQETKDTLHVVAVATSVRNELRNLNYSVSGAGYNLTVLGMNTTWQGLGSKVFYMIDWLKET